MFQTYMESDDSILGEPEDLAESQARRVPTQK